jgi:regulator of protease activity HflC (stomatin/prohibitin superfamily)
VNDNLKVSRASCIVTILFGFLGLGVLFLFTCTVKVPADQIAVRTVMTSSGIEEKDYRAGYVLAIPGLHKVKLWDPTWTNLKQSLSVRGSDQYTTEVDISVLYRIEPDHCHEVAKDYRDEEQVESRVKNMMNKYANEILAQMKTEDFYNSEIRDTMCGKAQKAIDAELRPNGIEVRAVLLRNIVYDPKFEDQLLQKQVAGQRKSLEMAKGLLAGAQTQLELIRRKAEADVKSIEENKTQETANLKADTERKVAQILQDAKLKSDAIVANAESERRQKLAQADFIKAKAQAEGIALMSKVYERPGASYYFARQAVENLKLGDIEVNSTYFNPLDSEILLRALGLDLQNLPAQRTPAGGTTTP